MCVLLLSYKIIQLTKEDYQKKKKKDKSFDIMNIILNFLNECAKFTFTTVQLLHQSKLIFKLRHSSFLF